MLDFFTTLLTPVFVFLGMVSAPVEMPVEVQPDVQQELVELRQKVQELENQNEPEVKPETQEAEEKVIETKPVPVVQPVTKTEPEAIVPVEIIIETPVEKPVEIDTAYQEKLARFYDRVETLEFNHIERINDTQEQRKINELNQELTELKERYDNINRSRELGLVHGLQVIDNSGLGIPSSITAGQQASSISAQQSANINFLYNYDNLKNSHLAEIAELDEDISKITQRHINEIKELQEDWGIKTEDRLY